jgi:hypothetical protein
MTFSSGFGPAAMTAAFEATPAVPAGDAAGSLDLAAMALVADELPAGITRRDGGTYTPGSLYGITFAPHVSHERLMAAGYLRNYETYYQTADEIEAISVSIDEYATPEGAIAGFAVFAEETRPAPNFTVLASTDLPGPAVGADPKVFSLTTYHYRNGTISHFADATVRVDNLIARITYERFDPSSESGTPEVIPGTPTAQDEAQVAAVEQMAATLLNRIETVRAGESPPEVDLKLAAQTLPLAQLPHVWNGESWEGYLNATDFFASDDAMSDQFVADFQHGYGRLVSLGTGSSAHPPYLSVAMAELSTPEAARALLDAARAAPDALRTPGPYGQGAQHSVVDDPSVPGSDAAMAFTSALDEEDATAPGDSAGVVFAQGSNLVAIAVQGMESTDAALAAARDLATQQAACLMSEAPCTMISPPVMPANSERSAPAPGAA